MKDNVIQMANPTPIYDDQQPPENRWPRLKSLRKCAVRLALSYLVVCGIAFNAAIFF